MRLPYRWLVAGFIVAVAVTAPGCHKKKPKPEPTPTPTPIAAATPRDTHVDDPNKGFDGSKTPAVVQDEPVSVDLPGPLKPAFFDFDRYDLRPDARQTLQENAAWLKANPMAKALIEGHCDERGTDEYNLALGDRRALAAKKYLVNLGIASARLSTLSYGEAKPFEPGHDEAAWAQNRRAHFRLVGSP